MDKTISEQILMAQRYAADAMDEADMYRPDAPLYTQHHWPPRGYWASEAMYDLMMELRGAWQELAGSMEALSTRLDRAMSDEDRR